MYRDAIVMKALKVTVLEDRAAWDSPNLKRIGIGGQQRSLRGTVRGWGAQDPAPAEVVAAGVAVSGSGMVKGVGGRSADRDVNKVTVVVANDDKGPGAGSCQLANPPLPAPELVPSFNLGTIDSALLPVVCPSWCLGSRLA